MYITALYALVNLAACATARNAREQDDMQYQPSADHETPAELDQMSEQLERWINETEQWNRGMDKDMKDMMRDNVQYQSIEKLIFPDEGKSQPMPHERQHLQERSRQRQYRQEDQQRRYLPNQGMPRQQAMFQYRRV